MRTSLIRKLKIGFFLTVRQKKMILSVFWLSIYRNVLLLKGTKKAFTEHICKNQETELTNEKIAIAKEIAMAISIVNKYLPWKNVCRHQSWQAVSLLLKYQVPFDYSVGIDRLKTTKGGHSWVKVNRKFICGECDEKAYFIVFCSRKLYH